MRARLQTPPPRQGMTEGMRLNHLNLSVTDVPASVAMFETYFGFTRSDMPVNEHMAFLHDESGFLLSMFRAKDVDYPKSFHIGFMQDSPEQVHAMRARLLEGGYAVPEPQQNHGRLTFYFNAPGGFVVEVESFLR
ncbi:VOC family protein [Deinococcus yunweiensis]|uniref:VOC family protein n=1 Tax=Deinococcus yunweiensis TaxID=367282 RepID=UPI00398E40FA